MPVQAAPRAAGSLLTAESSLRQCWELLVPPGYFPASSSLFPSVWVHAKLLLPGAQAALLISSHYPRNLLSGWLVQAVLPDLPASRVCPAASSFPAAEPLAGSMVQHTLVKPRHTFKEDLFSTGSVGRGSCWWGGRAGMARGVASPGCQASPSLLPVQQHGQGPLLSNSPCLLLPSPVLPWQVPTLTHLLGVLASCCTLEQDTCGLLYLDRGGSQEPTALDSHWHHCVPPHLLCGLFWGLCIPYSHGALLPPEQEQPSA